jgi:hypothetical protein
MWNAKDIVSYQSSIRKMGRILECGCKSNAKEKKKGGLSVDKVRRVESKALYGQGSNNSA